MRRLTLAETQSRFTQILADPQFDWERIAVRDGVKTVAGLVPPTDLAILKELESVPLDLIAEALEYAREENLPFREALLEAIECRYDLQMIEASDQEPGKNITLEELERELGLSS